MNYVTDDLSIDDSKRLNYLDDRVLVAINKQSTDSDGDVHDGKHDLSFMLGYVSDETEDTYVMGSKQGRQLKAVHQQCKPT